MDGLAGFDEGRNQASIASWDSKPSSCQRGCPATVRGVMGAAKCWHGDFHGLRVLHLNHRHVLMRAGVGFAGPVVEHDGLPNGHGVSRIVVRLMPAGLWGRTGVERAFEHGGQLQGLLTGGAAARQALHHAGLVVLVGLLGVIAQVVDAWRRRVE